MKQKQIVQLGAFKNVMIETVNVNNDKLVADIILFINECINNSFYNDLASEHDRDVISENIEYFCDILLDNNLVEQYDIIFDKRNNKRSDMVAGKVNLSLKFKQTHCLNVTQIKYSFGKRP